ncbi:hypothetical protein LX32DRAFT_148744 [Colletotrichum zoysiae]|uniref:Uncharacterized protein n=1 Tax=Colletotrichum zoysiae TaxID=1216348 RepID=A0AAD9H722_9PEZI|nr:hypothetical protein LX32DRAFT_148744 [Colletotrichum zoysiae]
MPACLSSVAATSSSVTLQLCRTQHEALYSCLADSCLTEEMISHYEPMVVSASPPAILCLWPSCCILTAHIDPETRLSTAQTAPSIPFWMKDQQTLYCVDREPAAEPAAGGLVAIVHPP